MNFDLAEEHRLRKDLVARFVREELLPLEPALRPAARADRTHRRGDRARVARTAADGAALNRSPGSKPPVVRAFRSMACAARPRAVHCRDTVFESSIMRGTGWRTACVLACGLAAGHAAAAAAPAAEQAAVEALQAAYARAATPGDDAARYRELLAPVLQRIQRRSATAVDLATAAADAARAIEPLPPGAGEPAAVFRTALQAAMRPIDPHFRYLDPRGAGAEQGALTGRFGGLGLEVEADGDAVRVVAPIPESPAARAGLLAGDRILRVDEQSLSGLPLADAIARMRGEPGTPVTLTIWRGGGAGERTVSLVRDTIRRQVVRATMEGDVLVLRLAVFSDTSASALEKAIAGAVAAATPKAAVLDLRGNPGGLLLEAIRIADAFLGSGDIVSLRGHSPDRQRTWSADPAELLAGTPMVVLVDRRSASASELVADALQHHGRAVVIGERSYGKGSVQSTIPLGEGNGAIKLTTSLYHGPSGQTLHRIGVAPDIELLPGAGSAREAGTVSSARTLARLDPARCAAAPAPDPALACALAYLRAGTVDAFVTALAPER